MEHEIIGLGLAVIDHIVQVGALPERDTKKHLKHHWFQVGGPVPTALAAATRLGRRCAFMGQWGDDAHGRMIEEDLRREGLDISRSVVAPEGRTGFAHIWVEDDGTRTSMYSRGDFEPLGPEDLRPDDPFACRLFHTDGRYAAASARAARAAGTGGARIVLDGGSRKPGVEEELLPLVDVLIASRQCMTDYAGTDDFDEAGPRLLDLGPAWVLLTAGDRGARFVSADRQFDQPAFPVKAVDTNGAGDVFCGAVLHGLLDGFEPERLLAFACAAAALKCAREGNRDALPDMEKILRFIKKCSADFSP